MKICVIADNAFLYKEFIKIIELYNNYKFDFFCSDDKNIMKYGKECTTIVLSEMKEDFFCQYDLFISLHSKQIFPTQLVMNHRCINVHPGLNPYNRGWYPQVFSIINKKPVGVTIHEMDTEVDHGPIIVQEEVPIYEYDTSYDVYQRIQKLEVNLLRENLEVILSGNYKTCLPQKEGNINRKKNFEELCCLDLNKKGTFQEFLDILRATTFVPYDNAYFYDDKGEKVYISLELHKQRI